MVIGVCAGKLGPLEPGCRQCSDTGMPRVLQDFSIARWLYGTSCLQSRLFLSSVTQWQTSLIAYNFQIKPYLSLECTSNRPFRIVVRCYSPYRDWLDPRGP